MARTKKHVAAANLDAAARAEQRKRIERKKAALLARSRILSSQEAAALTSPKRARAPSETEVDSSSDSESEHASEVYDEPEPKQVVKLSAQGSGGHIAWQGRLRGGGKDLPLAGTWVRKNFNGRFLEEVQAAKGRFVYIPTGCAQDRPAPVGGGLGDGPKALSAMGAHRAIPTVECPEVAHRQGAADLCAAYGLASAVHNFGDTSAAATIAACARAALASGDAFGHVQNTTNDLVDGWDVEPLSAHNPLASLVHEPVNMQLVGSDGAGTHAVATLGPLIFDAAEARALPLSRASLDRCVGAHLNGATFSHVARAVRLVPGKRVWKRLRASARA